MKLEHDIASIYELYVNDMFTYALYHGFEEEVIMDAIHDVFCKLASDETKLNNVSNLKFYLFKSLKNNLLDLYKTEKKRRGLIQHFTEDIPFNIQVSIEEQFIEKEEQQRMEDQISEMLNCLTNRQREIVYLRYVQEYDYDQISELLNISVHGCRKLLSKAMKNLREKYGILPLVFLFCL